MRTLENVEHDAWDDACQSCIEPAQRLIREAYALGLAAGRASPDEGRLREAALGLLELIGPSPVGITADPRGTYNQRVNAVFAALRSPPPADEGPGFVGHPRSTQGDGPCLCDHATNPRRAHAKDCPALKPSSEGGRHE